MASSDLSANDSEADLRPRMAAVGYGKHAVSGQGPRKASDFAHLPRREAAIASYIDRVPDGTCISIKALAAQLDYGQCALGTALRRLALEGHLRRFTERLPGGKHVTRTYFSRAPRSDAWWAACQRGQDMDEWQEPEAKPAFVPEAESEPVAEVATEPVPRAERAYRLLMRLGEADRRLMLSAAECRALQPQVEEWLKRDLSGPHFTTQMVSGLPPVVGAPKRFVEKRIEMKMPPERWSPRRTPLVLECVVCRTPGRPAALTGGVCDGCYGGVESAPGPVRYGAASGGLAVASGRTGPGGGPAVAGGAAAWSGTAAATSAKAAKPAKPAKGASIKIARHLVDSLPDSFLLNRAVVDPDALDREDHERVDAYVRQRASDIREAMREHRARSQ
ncbi:hypothetical protein ACFU99_04290 [Streptomyces sp. NPDC057654]|uniref:hypothetical protein n=1 Tax=Streptomyces sp. NPDC057654 TaxID=3346196 RepID=UPI00368A1CEE